MSAANVPKALTSRRQPSLESLRIFETVARFKSFTLAAADVGLTQSAVSLRMRDLQADLGTRIFASTRPRVRLTPEGEQLASAVASAMGIIRTSLEDLWGLVRPFRIHSNPTFANWLAPRLNQFASHEGIARIELLASTELSEFESPDGPDIAIRSGVGRWPNVVVEPLMLIDRVPLVTPQLAATLPRNPDLVDLLRLPLLPSPDWPGWFERIGLDGSDAIYAAEAYPTQALQVEAAAAGAGVALASPRLCHSMLEQKRLVAPWSATLSGPDGHYAVSRSEGPTAIAERFIGWLKQQLCTRPPA